LHRLPALQACGPPDVRLSLIAPRHKPKIRPQEALNMAQRKDDVREGSENRDPITHAPGAHPVGVGIGAAGAGAAGAAIGGAIAGPPGAMVGAAIGVVAGGMGGKAAAESVHPTIEDEWWRRAYPGRPYAKSDVPYEIYRPAYSYGWQARMMHGDMLWEEIEPNLAAGWEQARGESTLPWSDARHAAKDAWDRIGPPIGSSREPP
jgi:hypothetical protein